MEWILIAVIAAVVGLLVWKGACRYEDDVRQANGGRLPNLTYTSFSTGETVTIDGETGEEIDRRREPIGGAD